MSIVLGLDIGTSGTKGLAVNHKGAVLATASVEYPLYSPRPNWAEQHPADWKAAALEVLRKLVDADAVEATDIKALGLTGQMHGSVFLDANGEVLRPALLWCDQRTAKQCDAITSAAGGEEKLIEMVSNPALTGFTAPKILWLRENEPKLYERVQKVLLPKDYVRYELTGEFATDVADASGTLLFDVQNRRWHAGLMDTLGIPGDWMPPAYEGPEITGRVSGEVARATGLPEGTPVVAGGGDQAAGGVGCGVVRAGVLSASMGTSGVVFACTDDVARDPQGRVHTFCHSVPGKWHVMGVMLSAGGSLRWYRDVLGATERAMAEATGRDPYDYICETAAAAPAGSEGLIFLPYLTGERTPHKDPDAKGAYIGFSLRHTRAHMARAVLEGVAYGMRDGLDILREMGVPLNEIRATGGGARSALWRQIQADVYSLPLVTLAADEGPAYGASLLALVAAGEHNTVEDACDVAVKTVSKTAPDPTASRAYDDWLPHYREAYKALAPLYRGMGALLS